MLTLLFMFIQCHTGRNAYLPWRSGRCLRTTSDSRCLSSLFVSTPSRCHPLQVVLRPRGKILCTGRYAHPEGRDTSALLWEKQPLASRFEFLLRGGILKSFSVFWRYFSKREGYYCTWERMRGFCVIRCWCFFRIKICVLLERYF